MKQEESVKQYLIGKLKQEHCLWSYDNDSIHDMPDDMLIELVMLYLETYSSFCRMEYPSKPDSHRYFERFKRLRTQIDG